MRFVLVWVAAHRDIIREIAVYTAAFLILLAGAIVLMLWLSTALPDPTHIGATP